MVLFVVGIVFIVLWIIFYPPIYAIHDEAGYMGQSYVMRSGTIFGDVAGIPVVSSIETPTGHLVTKYAPGTSFLLIPFIFFGWKTIFLLPLLLHLLGFFIFLKILRFYNISPYFALLYLLYPASVLYSRTIMADLPSAVFFLIACYFFLKGGKSYLLSGFFLGIIPLFRYSNIILAIPFFLCLIIEFFKSRRKGFFFHSSFIKFLIGFLPGLFILLFYNKIATGGILTTSYGMKGYFSLKFFPQNLFFYTISLSLIYPLMFFTIFFLRRKPLFFLSTTLLFFVFYCCFYYVTIAPGKGMLKTQIVGMRFLLPIIPIFILSYADAIERIKKKIPKPSTFFFWSIVGIFSILNIGMVYKHQGFLKEQERYKNTIYANTDEHSLILTNYDGMEFFQPVWGKRQIAMFVYWQNRIPIDFSKYDFNKLYLLTVIRSDKEGNEYVKKYGDEIIKEYRGETVAEIKGDPELRLWKLHYESANDSVSEKRSIGEAEKEIQKREE